MAFIYNHHFKDNLYPSLVLKPNGESYSVFDANEAFLELMQVDKGSIKDKDFFETFLGYEENIASVTTCMVRTSLSYVKTFRIPKKIEKIGIIHSIEGKGKKVKYWEIFISPVLDETGKLEYILYISKDINEQVSE